MAYNIYLFSSPPPVLLVIIWSLVFHFILFRVYLTIVEAVILILKHATSLRLSNFWTSEAALTHVELEYHKANIDLKIQQYLEASSKVSSQEHTASDTIELHVSFIITTEIGKETGLFVFASVKIISHEVHTETTHQHLMPSQSSANTHMQRKTDHWFKQSFLPKSISLLKRNKK